jgi:thiamine monophosphate synthase
VEAERAREWPADYWSVGPCFATATKGDAGPALGADGTAVLVRLSPPGVPVIGIGGITAATVGEVLGTGAVGVAVSAAVRGRGNRSNCAHAGEEAYPVRKAIQTTSSNLI